MTVAELRKALDGVPDEMQVVSYDVGGYPQLVDTCAKVIQWGAEERYRPEKDAVGKTYFFIAA